MAKGGLSLNPGADATLVQAATNAAMANVPKDLSGTFEKLAESYDDTMQSVAESWGSVAEKIVPLAASMVKKALKKRSAIKKHGAHLMNKSAKVGDEGVLSKQEWEDMNEGEGPGQTTWEKGVPAVYNDVKVPFKRTVAQEAIPPKTEYQGDTGVYGTYEEYLDSLGTEVSISEMLTNIRDEQKSLFTKNDAESKKRKIELKADKEQIYSEIEHLELADNANTELLASGNFDEKATGQKNSVLAAAIQAYDTKSGKITDGPYEGYHVTLGRNKNDEFTFTLRDGEGDFVTGEDANGKLETGWQSFEGSTPFSISSSDVGNLLVPKYDDARIKEINKDIFDPLLKSNVKDVSKVNIKNKVAAYCDNENDLLGLMWKALGAEETSFGDAVTNPSPTSAGYFASLGQTKLEKLGAKDIDGDGDIDKDDLFAEGKFAAASAENYAKIKSALLDKSNDNYNWKQTQTAFLDYAQEAGENMHNFVPKGGGNNKNWTNPFGNKSLQIGDTWLGPTERWNRRQFVQKNQGFTGVYGKYAPTDDGWTMTNQQGTKPIDMYQLLEDEQLLLPGDINPTEKKKKEQEKFNNYSAEEIRITAGSLTNEKALMNAFKDKFKNTKFEFSKTYGDGKEIVQVKFDGGSWKDFTVSGNLPQQIAAYMNFKDPKDGATMIWPSGKHKGKKATAKDGEWTITKD